MSLANTTPIADIATLLQVQNEQTVLADPMPTQACSTGTVPVKCTVDGETCATCTLTGATADLQKTWDAMVALLKTAG